MLPQSSFGILPWPGRSVRDDPACRLSPPSPSLHEIPRQADYEFVCGDRSTWCRTTIDAEPMEVGLRLSHPHLAVHIPKHKFSLIAACGTRWVVPAFESLVQSIITSGTTVLPLCQTSAHVQVSVVEPCGDTGCALMTKMSTTLVMQQSRDYFAYSDVILQLCTTMLNLLLP